MAKPRLRRSANDRFTITWTDPETGRRCQRTTPDASHARWLYTTHLYIAAHDIPPRPTTIGELVDRWAHARSRSAATARRMHSTRRRLLEPFFGTRPAAQLGAHDIAAWLVWLHEHRQYTPRTIRTHFCVLRAALQWAADHNLLPANPCDRVDLPPATRSPAPGMAEPEHPAPPPPAPPAHHRATNELISLRHAVVGTAAAAEVTALLRRLRLSSEAG